MFSRALADVNRALLGPLCVYAPSMVGSVAVWRGFPHEPWSPDIDLVVAVADRALLASVGVRPDDPRFIVDDRFLARRATRGVCLSELLAAGNGARPPVELLARTAIALLRPGPRIARILCPQQIVVSYDGDVVVDGLDPEAHMRAWAPHGSHETHMHAALLAACAGGSERYADAALLVEDARRSAKNSASAVVKLIHAAASADLAGALDAVASLPAERSVIAGLVRGLFPARAAAVEETREELALLDRRVLPAWPRALEVVSEADRVAAELSELYETAAQCRALLLAAPPRVVVDPWWRRSWRSVRAAFARAPDAILRR